MSIRDWPESERPREKMRQRGPGALSDAELLALFLRTGIAGATAVDLAREVLQHFGGWRAVLESREEEFCALPGLGQASFSLLQAGQEINRRHLRETLEREQVFSNPESVRCFLRSNLRHRDREVFVALLMDSQHRLIHYDELFLGTVDSASVFPRELVKLVLQHNAAAIIVAHNHPSGINEPSQADCLITERIQQALALVGVRLLDHLIVGSGEEVSLAERGLLKSN
ncbi:DNA repair protein RadC [uncultured Pseudoteredinibacter sp.]|uniref:RadC family protein n=1 Tax=uncultured Pseudoteredinibacter sp. TaxID=1641701 RepID=UPI00261DF408|nr:DNA repair protein RadC [uncultured Pseudoteredinibacter sp.]